MLAVHTVASKPKSIITNKHVFMALSVSIVLHFITFQLFPNMHVQIERHIVVDAELLPPVIMEDAPRPVNHEPEINHETMPIKKSNQLPTPKSTKVDSGVALPVLADKTSLPNNSNDYVVREALPLTSGDNLPFESKVGSVALDQHIPDSTSEESILSSSDMDDYVDSDILGLFGRSFKDKISQFKSYPVIASRRGWQGSVLIQIRFSADGTSSSISVKESCGHKVLDDHALKMVRLASKEIMLPKQLLGKKFSVTIPVEFKLKSVE